MFNLEREVSEWCRSIHAGRGRSGPSVRELEDHILCEVEGQVGQGLSEEAAFQKAKERMGDSAVLAKEISKNRGFFSRLDHFCFSRLPELSPRTAGVLNILTSIVFAVAMLVAAAVIEEPAAKETTKNVILALWIIPFSFFASSRRRNSTCGCGWRRKFFS